MHKPRVLIADDYDGIRLLLRAELEHHGFEVTEAEDGREALEIVRSEWDAGRSFDLAILDHLMPHYKGDVVIVEIKKMAEERGVKPPVTLMLTGSNDPTLAVRVKTAGLGTLYFKPDIGDLMDRILGVPAVAR